MSLPRTPYAAALRLLGLSRAEAAALHQVRPDTIASWATGRRSIPAGAWDDLRALYRRMQAGDRDVPAGTRALIEAREILERAA